MKKAVMYGAGNIGRGFIGEIFSKSGYEVVFIDINLDVIDALNKEGRYPVRYVSNEKSYDVWVENVRGVDGAETQQVAYEIATCDIMATAVGVNVLRHIAKPIAEGIAERSAKWDALPLDIIICENLVDANIVLQDMILENAPELEGVIRENVGFVEASIGRMVPVIPEKTQKENPLCVCVEPYATLPVDKNGFKGEIPFLVGMEPHENFDFYIRRKLYIHNMGHAVTAYLGKIRGYEYIWEAIQAFPLRFIVRQAMMTSATALAMAYKEPLDVLEEHVDDLLNRFGNKKLGDSVARVGRDLDRKLAPDDRLIGAINLCVAQKCNVLSLFIGLAAALHFDDGQPGTVAKWLRQGDIERVVKEHCKLNETDVKDILILFNALAMTKEQV